MYMYMKYLCAFLLSFLFIMPALAQDQASSEITVNPDNVKELIKTLESETARQDFIGNLKTLAETSETTVNDTEEPVVALSESLGFGQTVDVFFSQYQDFLKEYNVNEGIVGRIGLTVVATIIALILVVILRKIIQTIREKGETWGQRVYLNQHRFRIYTRGLRYIGKGFILILYMFALTSIWQIGADLLFNNDTTSNALNLIINVIFVIFLGAFVWETINAFVEHLMAKADAAESNRLRTLIPIVRTIITIVFGLMFALVLLSELGINIVPLMAGAGVLGIAIGFGAQKFVQDFITGFTIILEDLFNVGDVISVGGKAGVVEAITLRKVQLRGYDGIVYTVPFSEISTIDNLTKDFSYYLIDMGVAYREDTDEVTQYMRDVVDELMNDDDYKDMILEPLDVAGVDQFADSSVIIKARIKTKPIQQWTVGREFNRRIKKVFDANNIEIPFPYQTMVLGMDKDGNSIGGPTSADVRASANIAPDVPVKHKKTQK